MKNIVLLCAQGMSTGMLMNKMRAAAKASGYECTISASSVSQAKTAAETADCILYTDYKHIVCPVCHPCSDRCDGHIIHNPHNENKNRKA